MMKFIKVLHPDGDGMRMYLLHQEGRFGIVADGARFAFIEQLNPDHWSTIMAVFDNIIEVISFWNYQVLLTPIRTKGDSEPY